MIEMETSLHEDSGVNEHTAPPARQPAGEALGSNEDLCDRCKSFPWADFAKTLEPEKVDLSHIVIKEDQKSLMTSECRMCRLLGTIKENCAVPETLSYRAPERGSDFKGLLHFPPWNGRVPLFDASQRACIGILDNCESGISLTSPRDERINYKTLQRWLESCITSHGPKCTLEASDKPQDLLVIDCKERVVRSAPVDCRYFALSYVWGSAKDEDENNFPDLPSTLPNTIEDAIEVTKNLGGNYLWVDRYCINQADGKHKHLQIRQMGAIYAHAEATIVAVTGSDSSHGLSGVGISRQAPSLSLETFEHVTLVNASMDVADHIVGSLWCSRAWTLQEASLSRRLIFFTDQYLLFVCRTDLQADVVGSYSLGRELSFAMFGIYLCLPSMRLMLRTLPLRMPEMVLACYTQRQLRYESDALNAILGILECMAKDCVPPVFHMWGTPLVAVSTSNNGSVCYRVYLDWAHLSPCIRRERFPSWTLIGWEGAVAHGTFERRPTQVPSSFAIHIRCRHGLLALQDYVESGLILQDSGLETAPAQIEISHAVTSPVTLKFTTKGEVGIMLQCEEAIDTVHPVSWDEEMSLPSDDSSESGFVALRTHEDQDMLTLLVLRKEEDIYTRVGIVLIDKAVGGLLVNSDVIDRASGAHITDAGVLCERSSGDLKFVYQYDQSLVLA